jgi:signal transduction histidine kinase
LDSQLLRLYLLIGALMIFLSGVIIFANSLFIRSIVGPILQINQLAQTIKSGQYGARLDVAFNDEIGELCNTLNGMSAELARMEQVKNDFISSVSHELRTPLTAIKGWTETLMDEEDAALRGAGLRIMQKETGRLNQMVEELLDFSRMESGRLRLQTEYVDLRGELYDAVFIYRDMLAQEGLRVVYTEPEEPVVVNADRNRMKQVFLNVIDNAGKYGRDGDRVEVSIAAEAGNCVVHIRDFGQGIPAEELPRIKEKFFKGSAKGRGTGIGLAVCNEIVELHGGTLEVSSTYGAGTDVCVRLPLQIHKSEEQEQ